MKTLFSPAIHFLTLALVIGVSPAIHAQGTSITAATVSVTTSTEAQPVAVGEKAPDAIVYDEHNNPVRLSDLYSSGPTLLVFYRGGWCPYCSTHLGKLATAEDRITELGYKIYAISPDSPQHVQVSDAEIGGKYQLLSDSSADAIRAFGLAFRVDDNTFERYKNFKNPIDLEARAGGQTHHLLPIPAAYIIDKNGVVQYEYHHTNYKERVDIDALLDAATTAQSAQ